jgi:signal transduction histidine kinase
VGLALFFVVPTVGFAAWSFGRLEEEFRGARELLVQRTLGDAAAEIAQEPEGTPLQDVARRIGSELFLSKGGALSATSAPVLADLGLADALVPGEVFARLAYGDELEAAAPQRAAPAPTLVGYRLVTRAEPADANILAAPEVLSDRALQRREADLAIAVLVAVVLGIVAALGLAGVAARAIAEPLEALRHAALGVAGGLAPAVGPRDVPVELEPIRDALAQAAADVEAGRHAQRVLAWGEMARQVAHEIKNPLTPIRLGIQHLLRLHEERPADVAAALPDTGQRILSEIDRLDGIARTFSRFALPGAEAGGAVDAVDLTAVVNDVLRLYRMGEGGVMYQSAVEPGLSALARRDELVEVLVNLCENARDAGAHVVVITALAAAGGATIQVRDDGRGIAPDVLPRVFEPRFSTTTSGSGLGLAIARRLVESWGGRIEVADTGPGGTTVRLDLRAALTTVEP